MSRIIFAAAILTLAGLVIAKPCPAADVEIAAAQGTVTLDGQPLETGRIILHQKDGQFFGAKLKDGKFKLDHVPVGKYVVTIERKIEGADSLPRKYSSEDKSELTVEVKKGANTLDFALTSK
jgi:hypothetical protein